MSLAWDAGAVAHAAGLSVHHVLKDADLLLAILLWAVEDAARAGELSSDVAADAFAVARRLQQAVALHAQAASSSYLHALVGAMRSRWRLLRHDLRNPLGTIRSAVSLMEDEALPAEARTGPRVRAMVARNAGSLERLIADGLDDRVAEALVAAPQEVSLRDVALAVRRTLRDSIRLAQCEVVVDDDLPSARVDEAAMELTLSTLLLAAIARARPGDVLRVTRATSAPPDAVALYVLRERDGADAWDADDLALSTALAREYGGRVAVVPELALEMPLLPGADGGSVGSNGGPRRATERRARASDARASDARASDARAPDALASERHLRDDVSRAD
jgi:K+-sensing histidine kinase KdpD